MSLPLPAMLLALCHAVKRNGGRLELTNAEIESLHGFELVGEVKPDGSIVLRTCTTEERDRVLEEIRRASVCPCASCVEQRGRAN